MAVKRIQSRAKGKRVELAAAAYLRSIGFNARRGQQYRGGNGSPDVVVDELPRVWIEVKGDEKIDLGTQALEAAMNQAARDSGLDGGLKVPVVLWRRNGSCWRLTFDVLEDSGIYGNKPVLAYTVAGEDDIRHALLWLQREREAA